MRSNDIVKRKRVWYRKACMTLRGAQGFRDYYQQFFPSPEACAAFLSSLEETTLPVLRFGAEHEERLRAVWDAAGLPWKTLDWYPNALLWPEGTAVGDVLPGYAAHLFYPMSASSLLPVLALDVQPEEQVLDACAAPGGKVLFIADELRHGVYGGERGELIANDISSARRDRMKRVLREYEHPEVIVWGTRAEVIFKKHRDAFDKILVDAPCSSEKHVYNQPHALQQWTSARVRQLRQRQIALLSGLFLALKPGGRMVYSTCAVTPEENERVVEILLKKKGDAIRLIPFSQAIGASVSGVPIPGAGCLATPHQSYTFDCAAVHRILPHRDQLDPMFIAIFERLK